MQRDENGHANGRYSKIKWVAKNKQTKLNGGKLILSMLIYKHPCNANLKSNLIISYI